MWLKRPSEEKVHNNHSGRTGEIIRLLTITLKTLDSLTLNQILDLSHEKAVTCQRHYKSQLNITLI